MSLSREHALARGGENWNRWVEELKAFIAFPSISGSNANVEGIQGAAAWIADTLRSLDLDGVAILPTEGNPIVVAEDLRAGSQAPTMLIYGHYDVVVAEPLEDWESDPFQAVVKGEVLYGRGASDMKGQIITCLAAVEALRSGGPPPLNLKFLLEGEEEYPPRHLEGFLGQNRERLRCDLCLNPDAGMVAPGIPGVVYSLRGNMLSVLRVSGPREALHTGLFGGVVHNPIHVLSDLIAGLHDKDGRVAIPGFYENVRPLGSDERALLDKLPVDEGFYLDQSGVPALWGEPGYSLHERIGARPAINVVRFETEHEKPVIPAEAKASITIRIVPDQEPPEIHAKLKRYVAEHAPPTVTWDLEFRSGYPPMYTERNSTGIQALGRAIETTWGQPPVFSRDGGGIPAAAWIQRILGVESVLTGFSSPADNLHGPNEGVHLPTLKRGVMTLIHFMYELAGDG